MKGNDTILAHLNELLAEELTAINQYMVHSEMCANWGYERLHHRIERRAIQEMKHAEKLIARILFLEGLPVVSTLNALHIGVDVKKQFEADHDAEIGAVKNYNTAVNDAARLGDNGTREMLEGILAEEEEHVDWLEAQLDQIGQLGLPVYLAEQIRE